MPKFWAKDYLAEALREQRAVVERMSIAPPAHIEIVDCYAHKGEVDNVHYSMPWIHISPDADYNLQLHVPTSLLEPVRSDLQSLAAAGSGGSLTWDHLCTDGVERYHDQDSGSESLFSDDGERETASSGLTQEIDSAVERIMSSVMSSPGVGGRSHVMGSGEEFTLENLRGWEMYTTSDVAELYLEEHESYPRLASLVSALPGASDLVVRLKPKLISDPLLNPTTGKLHSYMQVCSSDFKFCVVDSTSEELPLINDPKSPITARDIDSFPREVMNNTTDDPVLELVSPQPLLRSSPSDMANLLPPLPQLPSPVREEGGEEGEGEGEGEGSGLGDNVKPEDELSLLVSKTPVKEVQRRQDQQLHYSSPSLEKVSSSTVDFLTLNNADVSLDSEDSGIGHAVLESPCVPLPSPRPHPSPSLPAQLARLEPLPVSPYSPHKLVLLSPDSEERLLVHLQEECRTFDSVLAFKLPYTGCGNYLDAVLKSYEPLYVVRECCNVQPINLTGDSELALPWDPLASSYHIMTAAQRAVVCLKCPLSDGCSKGDDWSNTTESFVKDATVKTLGAELADTALGMLEGSDVPSLHAAPPGYIKRGKICDLQQASKSKPEPAKSRIGEKRSRNEHRLQFEDQSLSPVDMFIMLRTGTLSPEITKKFESSQNVKEPDVQTEVKDPPEEKQPFVTSSTVQDVYLNRDYQLILSKVAHYGVPLMEALQAHGLPITRGTLFGNLDPDDVKFFLKQQQKCLADSQGSEAEEVLLQSCKLAACLYVLVSFANGVTDINLATGVKRFTFLHEKYEDLIGSSLDLAKQGLADIQLGGSGKQGLHHPKLHSMVSIVNSWKTSTRKHIREKVVVVVGKDFTTVSGDILDFLKSISDLKSCVFSFACDSPTNPLYLEALEERFHFYDCLVMPVDSIVSTFPWEKVSLLVEYEPLGSILFPDGQLPASLRLRQWLVLKTARDISATSLAKAGTSTRGGSTVLSFQYTLIASENITTNPKLLQLLESRFNMLLISRDYEQFRKKMGSSFSYADLIVDQTTGIIVHRLSVLSSDAGVHIVSARAAALSLQYERLWILLHAEPESSYPYGGSVPVNLARLHASVAHYSTSQDAYRVKVMCASGCEEVAQLVRSIADETRSQSEGINGQNWSDREWIADDLATHEMFLLSFPCLNSFSVQLLLKACSLRQILTLSQPQLQELFPWLPAKVLKFFTRMCHAGFQEHLSVIPPAVPSHETSELIDNSTDVCYNRAEAPIVSLDDSLQYVADEPCAVEHGRNAHVYQTEGFLPFSDGVSAPWSSEGDADQMGTYPSAIPGDMCETDTAEDIGTEHNSFFPLPNDLLVRDEESEILENDVPLDALSLPTTQTHSATSLGLADVISTASSLPCPVPPFSQGPFERRATLRVPSQREVQTSLLSKLSAPPNGHHFAVPQNIAKEYYGNDPMQPRLVTSGMVRRTPSRQPIKSLDLDLGVASASKAPQPRLQTNDRAVAMSSEGRFSKNVSFIEGNSGSSSRLSKRDSIQGVADLMAFHSRQGATSDERSRASLRGTGISRQKRPLPSTPIFDCQVPTHAISPNNNGGESSLYSSPSISLGSFKLSPVRKRRLVYKRLPSNSDGQTKLAFE